MKTVMSRAALATALAFSCAVMGLTPAKAVTLVNYDLSSPHNTNPGNTEVFTPTTGPAAATITAAGFSYTGSLLSNPFSSTAINLYNKYTSGDATETGLGIHSDPTGNNEIYTGTLIRIDVTTAIANSVGGFFFTMGSTTQGEAWSVYGSNSANSGLVSLYSHNTGQSVAHTLSLYDYYYFVYTGPARIWNSTCGGCNVLLTSFGGITNSTDLTTPLPGALPLFASGLGALGLFGWRRKRKAIASRAA
jgi:hypothetical protein